MLSRSKLRRGQQPAGRPPAGPPLRALVQSRLHGHALLFAMLISLHSLGSIHTCTQRERVPGAKPGPAAHARRRRRARRRGR